MSICTFKPCGVEAVCKGLCMGHYKQQLNGKPLTVIDRDKDGRIIKGKKKCSRCKKMKPTKEFYFNSLPQGKLRGECIDCTKDGRKK